MKEMVFANASMLNPFTLLGVSSKHMSGSRYISRPPQNLPSYPTTQFAHHNLKFVPQDFFASPHAHHRHRPRLLPAPHDSIDCNLTSRPPPQLLQPPRRRLPNPHWCDELAAAERGVPTREGWMRRRLPRRMSCQKCPQRSLECGDEGFIVDCVGRLALALHTCALRRPATKWWGRGRMHLLEKEDACPTCGQ